MSQCRAWGIAANDCTDGYVYYCCAEAGHRGPHKFPPLPPPPWKDPGVSGSAGIDLPSFREILNRPMVQLGILWTTCWYLAGMVVGALLVLVWRV